ncbi:alkene reductase [Chitinophaga sp. 30R24]|uniref:alkene reductase n=1 Tax=Chitinophaga sp. 30R24 TaxID=3248838 RepID=UPI003B8EC1C6
MVQEQQKTLLTEYLLGDLKLPNRVVMASLTRARATNTELAPNELHVQYYAQRASAGLILTESAWVSKRAIGFINIPGIFTQAQTDAWEKVTHAVHEKGGRIMLQLVHSGATSHPDYLDGALPLGPSAVNPQEKSYTPTGFKDTVTPKAYTIEEIKETVAEYKLAAINAKNAGFDGVELHAQLYTLIPQFLSKATNQRTDEYGGSIENRSRILFEILEALISVFPGKKVGIKFTPAAFNAGIIKPDEDTIQTFDYVFSELNNYDIAFIELVGPSLDLKETVLESLKDNFYEHFRALYKGTLMANLGFGWETGNRIIAAGNADIVSFGAPFIANPDLVERFQNSFPLAMADTSTYYTGGEKGYTDYQNSNN